MHPSSKSAPASRRLIFSASHQGARDYQEDRHAHWTAASAGTPIHFAVVIDGAGGHGGGSEAAEAALRCAEAAWKSGNPNPPEDFLKAWMKAAHAAVNLAGSKIHRSARAVAVACISNGTSAHWVHAGDSRLLHFRQGSLISRTRDDSVVQVLFEQGEIREEEMGTHPDQGRLLQSLGGEDEPKPRHGQAELQPGDALLLCSDGFWEHLSKADLESLIRTPPASIQAALDAAVAEAVRRAGPKADNTTAIILLHPALPKPTGHPLWMTLVAATALLLATAITFQAYLKFRSRSDKPNPEPSRPALVIDPEPTIPPAAPIPEPPPPPADGLPENQADPQNPTITPQPDEP